MLVIISTPILISSLAFDSISDKARLYIALGIISIVIINIVSFYLIIALGRKNLSMMENEKLRIKVAYNQQYVENADIFIIMKRQFKYCIQYILC